VSLKLVEKSKQEIGVARKPVISLLQQVFCKRRRNCTIGGQVLAKREQVGESAHEIHAIVVELIHRLSLTLSHKVSRLGNVLLLLSVLSLRTWIAYSK